MNAIEALQESVRQNRKGDKVMSELKSFESERIYWAVEQVERVPGDVDELHLDDNTFYIKSEADKVIAEKDAEIAKLKESVKGLILDNYLKDKEIAELKK